MSLGPPQTISPDYPAIDGHSTRALFGILETQLNFFFSFLLYVYGC